MIRNDIQTWRDGQAALEAEWSEHHAHESGDDLENDARAELAAVLAARSEDSTLSVGGPRGRWERARGILNDARWRFDEELAEMLDEYEASGDEYPSPRLVKALAVQEIWDEADRELIGMIRDIAQRRQAKLRTAAFKRDLARIRALPEAPTTHHARPRERRASRPPGSPSASADPSRPREDSAGQPAGCASKEQHLPNPELGLGWRGEAGRLRRHRLDRGSELRLDHDQVNQEVRLVGVGHLDKPAAGAVCPARVVPAVGCFLLRVIKAVRRGA